MCVINNNYYNSVLVLDTMSTHEPVPALSSIAVDPSPYSSLQYTYYSQPLHDILYNEPTIPLYPNVESSFTQRPHPEDPPTTLFSNCLQIRIDIPQAALYCAILLKLLGHGFFI